jgi:hypothetical protein
LRFVIRYFCVKDVAPVEMRRQLVKVYRSRAVLGKQFWIWYSAFDNDKTECYQQAAKHVTNDSGCRADAHVVEDRGIKLTDIAVERDTSLISAHSAVQHQMGYINVFTHVVPKILTDYYHARLMELSVIPMARYYDQGQQCLHFHVTGDERWVDNATPENPAKKSP